MGASQSSKSNQSQLILGNSIKSATFSNGKSNSSHLLKGSLRKSIMGNVLSGKKSKQQQQQQIEVAAAAAVPDGQHGSLLFAHEINTHSSPTSYYVPSLIVSERDEKEKSENKSKSKSKTGSKSSKSSKCKTKSFASLDGNNYVTIQQQQQQQQQTFPQDPSVQLELSSSISNSSSSSSNNNTNSNNRNDKANNTDRVKLSSKNSSINSVPIKRRSSADEQQKPNVDFYSNYSGLTKLNARETTTLGMELSQCDVDVDVDVDVDGSFSAANNAQQDHHHHSYKQMQPQEHRLHYTTNSQHPKLLSVAGSRFVEQQQRQVAVPFQLSKAVNTKTSNVLTTTNTNMVAMPARIQAANNNSTRLASSYHNEKLVGSEQQQQPQQQLANGSQVAYATSPQAYQNFYHVDVNDENSSRFYTRNLLDFSDFERLNYSNNNNLYQQDFHQLAAGGYFSGNGKLKQQPLTLDHRNYNRSYSFGSSSGSKTLEARHQHQHQQAAAAAAAAKKTPVYHQVGSKQHSYSNTINLTGRRAASNKFASSLAATNQRGSCPGSLKRIKSGPALSAQQASYEAMRTIDMYLIRQIAHSCMDFEMEQKIDLEIRLRELAAQSMLEARTEIDVLEVEKSLLTSDQRMNCYASQLEQQRKQLSNPSLSTDSGRGSKSGHHYRHHRSDVIGGPAASGRTTSGGLGGGSSTGTGGDASSPSFSSLSNSQSPSKLSPVSGESANSQPSLTSSQSRHSRSNYHYRTSSNNNTLSAKQKSKNKKRQQLIQSITHLSNINCNMVLNSRASVSLSEIRIPLMWRDVDHFKGRGDYKRFAVFCLLKIDSQIYDTQLISDVDRQVTDVCFDDVVVFNEIDHNFELTLEVYSCVYLEQFSLSSTPRKLKEKLTNSVSRAMGRRLATQTASIHYTKELQAYDKSYRFAMIASAILKLEDASDSVKTYDLVLVSPEAHHRQHLSTMSSGSNPYNSNDSSYSYTNHNTLHNSNSKEANKNTLPLFGHFCSKLFVKPDVFDKNIRSGYLRVAIISVPSNNLPENNSQSQQTNTATLSSKMATLSMSSSTVHWALLRNFSLHLWPIDETKLKAALARGQLPQIDHPRRPPMSVNINKFTRLLRVSNSSITLETDKTCLVLGMYNSQVDHQLVSSDEIGLWLRAIEQLIYDSHIWGSVLNHYPPTTNVMNLSDPNIGMSNAITTNM